MFQKEIETMVMVATPFGAIASVLLGNWAIIIWGTQLCHGGITGVCVCLLLSLLCATLSVVCLLPLFEVIRFIYKKYFETDSVIEEDAEIFPDEPWERE
jgi:hypothetical protein